MQCFKNIYNHKVSLTTNCNDKPLNHGIKAAQTLIDLFNQFNNFSSDILSIMMLMKFKF